MEKDPYMEEQILHHAQAHTEDFVTGLEVGLALAPALLLDGSNERQVRDAAFDRAKAKPGKLEALILGARAAIDHLLETPPGAA